jgi:formylglycine-generating enzyme required for sulfatase activity
MMVCLFASSLIAGCEVLPEGPVTPDGYRPPDPTQENIKNMVRDTIRQMVFIKGGSYQMGNVICFNGDRKKNAEKFQIQHMFCSTNESPIHQVTLNSFHISKYEISFYEYDLFTQATQRPFIQERYLNPEWWRSRDRTMEAVIERFSGKRTGKLPAAIDWFQASDYCHWLGMVTGLPVGLPT